MKKFEVSFYTEAGNYGFMTVEVEDDEDEAEATEKAIEQKADDGVEAIARIQSCIKIEVD